MAFIKDITDPGVADRDLVTQYQQTGELRVLSTLFLRYSDLLYGVCLKYLKEPEAARDAVMQIFEELVLKLKRHQVEHFKSWLYAVARNYCLMQLRTPRTLKTVEFNADSMYLEEDAHLNGVLAKEQQLLTMEKCLQTLSPDQKRAVELFYLQEKCYKEIAELTGHAWDKVRSFIQNGRRNLKICMDKQVNRLNVLDEQ